MKTTKERRKEKRLKIEENIEYLQLQLENKVKKLEKENVLLKQKLEDAIKNNTLIKEFNSTKIATADQATQVNNISPQKNISPPNKKFTEDNVIQPANSGLKDFDENKIIPQPVQMLSDNNINQVALSKDKKTLRQNVEEKSFTDIEVQNKQEIKEKTLESRLIELKPLDYYTSLSDDDYNKEHLSILDSLLVDKDEVLSKIKYIANYVPINKIKYLEEKKISAPTVATIPQARGRGVPQAPAGRGRGTAPPTPPVRGGTAPRGRGNPVAESKANNDEVVELIDSKPIDDSDIILNDNTVSLGKFIFVKLFKKYLIQNGHKRIDKVLLEALENPKNPILKLDKNYFLVDNKFTFKNLDRYLLLGYQRNMVADDYDSMTQKVTDRIFKDSEYYLCVENLKDLELYYRLFKIDIDFTDYINYAVNEIKSIIKKQKTEFHEIQDIFIYSHNKTYSRQKEIVIAQYSAQKEGILLKDSKPIILGLIQNNKKIDIKSIKTEFEKRQSKKNEQNNKKVDLKPTKITKKLLLLYEILGCNESQVAKFNLESSLKFWENRTAQDKADILIENLKQCLKEKDDQDDMLNDKKVAEILYSRLTKYQKEKFQKQLLQ